ncbi:MAG: TadE/TadG family type IV pilus assembly protein [Myxococcota bacterium]
MRTSNAVTGSRTRRRGAAAIEFALWLPVLLMFLSAVVDWGYYMTQRVAVARAVMEGTRRGAAQFESPAVAAGSVIGPTAGARASLVLTELGITCPAANCIVSSTYCDTGQGGVCNNPPIDALVVQIQYDFEPFFGLVPTPAGITERFEMAVENQRP